MDARILYHFALSPFSRRVRLALAHKSLASELRDGRADPALLDEARAHTPLRTLPVLLEPDGRALGDSTAIAHYLDHAYPDAPQLWPRADAHAVFEVATLVDVALNTLVDLGTRFYAARASDAWPGIQKEMIGRAQRALDALGDRVEKLAQPTVSRSGWCAADMWLFTAAAWLEGLPSRAPTNANVAQVVSLGWSLPPALSSWMDAHRARSDVHALG
jgi:glutathione S-transferase